MLQSRLLFSLCGVMMRHWTRSFYVGQGWLTVIMKNYWQTRSNIIHPHQRHHDIINHHIFIAGWAYEGHAVLDQTLCLPHQQSNFSYHQSNLIIVIVVIVIITTMIFIHWHWESHDLPRVLQLLRRAHSCYNFSISFHHRHYFEHHGDNLKGLSASFPLPEVEPEENPQVTPCGCQVRSSSALSLLLCFLSSSSALSSSWLQEQ